MDNRVINELIFVVFDGKEGGLVATEGNIGLVAMGDSDEDLMAAIRYEVSQHFGHSFHGTVRMRKFTDTIIFQQQ